MKTVLTAVLSLVLLVGLVSATTITMDSASGPGTGFDNQFIYEYDYDDASVTVTFDPYDDGFAAYVVATGLKPSFTYQVKLEGQGSLSAQASTNELIGLNGRWWYNGNRDDAYYLANKDSQDIVGYLVFDHFTTDATGAFSGTVAAMNSYHVLFCDDGLSGNGDLYAIADEPAYAGETLKCADSTLALCPSASVYGQIERPGFSGLPDGAYEEVIFVINEESFHVSCGTWTTAMTKTIGFEIAGDANVCGNGVVESFDGEECDDGNDADFDGCSSDCEVEHAQDHLLDAAGAVIGKVSYDACNPTMFSGEVDTLPVTSGVKNHQLKLEGKPSCVYPAGEADDWANEQIGLQGRFWCTNNCPCAINPSWGGCNIDDNALYLAHKDDPGFCATGYALFDCAASDASGEVHASFDLDSSYATCSSYLGAAVLPEGDYSLRFLLGQDYSPWGTVGVQDVWFSVGECSPGPDEVPEFGVLAAFGILALAGLFVYKKRK